MNHLRRMVSFLLVLVLCFGLIPGVSAAEVDTPGADTQTEATETEETTPATVDTQPTEELPPETESESTEPPSADVPMEEPGFMDAIFTGASVMSIASTQNSIMLFDYADNGNYTTVLNSQVACAYKPNGSGTTRTAYIKNLGWHFARYGGVAYADDPLYCIEPWRNYAASTSGNSVDRGVTLDGSGSTTGSNVWYALPEARREAIGLILLYSNQMWDHSISVTTTSKANNPNVPLRIATQFLIYEIVCGLRNPTTFESNSTNECGTSGDIFYNAGAASVPYFAPNYNALVDAIQAAKKIPSFTSTSSGSAPTINLTGEETSVYDSNGVLSNFSFTDGSGAEFYKSGSTLYITQTGDISSSTVYKATRYLPSAASSTYNIWYMSGSSYQTTVSLASASSGNLNAYFKLKAPALGAISLTKTTEDGQNLSGWQFGIYSNSACSTLVSGPHSTNTSGKISVTGLTPGTYYVKEIGHTDSSINALYYCSSTNPQSVTVTAGATATVSFTNKLNTGSVKLVKATNTGANLSGWQIGLYTDAACTNAVSGSPFTTGADGTVTAAGLQKGTYYAKEIPIFLQKRDRPIEIDPDWVHLGQTEDGYAINSYFLDHPEMVMGRNSSESTAHGMDYTVEPLEDISLADQLHEAVQHIHGTYQEAELPDLGEGEAIQNTLPADPDVKNFSYTLVDGEVYFRENSIMVRPDLNTTAKERIKGMLALSACVHELIDLQMDETIPDSAIAEKQGELNRLYDSFTEKYGLINSRGNRLAFSDDSSYFLLCALEVMDDDGNFQRKADMFTKRTIQPHRVVTSVDTASEALTLSIAEKAEVDMEYMSSLTGKTAEELASELRGVIFHDPTLGNAEDGMGWVTADEYLSGNVRQKLRQAEAAAAENPAYQVNVEALRAAQPKDLDASEIEVRLGATWIDRSYIKQFMFETFDTPSYLRYSMDVQYSPYTAAWSISNKTRISYNDVAAWNTYGTDCVSAYEILEDSLNLRDVQVYDTIEDADGHKKRVLNAKETTLAAQKQQLIRDAFRDWIWADPERRQALVRQYNEEMNSTRPREYDGSHIVFAGMNPEITLREHQRNAIAHVLYGGNTLLAHEVGAGKTFEMVAAAMESKRLGLCQKSIFVVPNHLTEQWASEFLRLYPSANILVTKQRDFETKNRKKFCARIATGDYDAVIIGHSQFEKIPISKQRQERLLQDQIAEITMGISELKESGGEKFSVKELERTKRGLESRLEKLRADDKKDDVVTFEELGVDRMFVDEAHNYKNLFLYTKMRNVAGLSTTDAQKSSDMFGKCRYMDELTGNRGVVFATGTPVSNSMTELYTMQRYLQYARLEEMHMTHFDCWASRFGETVTALELAPEGKGYRPRTRFSRFFNLPELMNLFKEVADIKTADQLHLPVPEVEYHNVVAKPTEVQKGLVQELSERAAAIHSGSVDPSTDNMLKVTSDGRKLGLDQRIINPDFPDQDGSKVNLCVENILQVWKDGEADKLTQLVFCDISTPQAAPKTKKAVSTNLDTSAPESAMLPMEEKAPFTVYDDIRSKLIARGVPAEQIAFIHDANTEVKKKELFGKVRSGQVRVLLGSTSKMGAGTNVQDRLVAIHDVDCPWRPGDLQQRKGRIERQGNQNEKVHVFRYVTEGTFDAYLWQTVENKQKFISQIMSSKSPVRSCDDVDEVALSFAEIKALCAGDPRIKERMDLDVEVSKLKIMKADYKSKQYRLEDNLLRHFPEQIEKLKGYIQAIQADMQTLEAHPHPTDGFAGMTVLADELTDKDNAGAALIEASKKATGLDPAEVGTYRGFQMSVTLEDFGKKYVLTMQGRLRHQATLGSDPRGNLIRLDNALAQMPQRLKAFQTQLDETYHQQEAAKAELGKPFPYEEELRDKTARLIFLDSELNLDANKGGQQEQVVAKAARPSVLDKLRSQPTPIKTDKKQKRHEEVR